MTTPNTDSGAVDNYRKERTVGRKNIGLLTFAAYVATIFAANWAINRYGIVPIGFGLMAPAGVFFAGLAFTLRDVTQETLGRAAVVGAILVGAAASYTVSPAFATASAVAFLVSELADFAVYTPLRRRQWDTAVMASGLVGAVVDSLLFLHLAFGSIAFWQGNTVGKLYMVAAAWLLWRPWRTRVLVAA